jgi:hypothetical protein
VDLAFQKNTRDIMKDEITILDLSDLLFYVCPEDQLSVYNQTQEEDNGNETESKIGLFRLTG